MIEIPPIFEVEKAPARTAKPFWRALGYLNMEKSAHLPNKETTRIIS
ncbi:hypothetical protein [Oscillibacter sp.]|nr:hypothetical protein [Oscillibacter sp.]